MVEVEVVVEEDDVVVVVEVDVVVDDEVLVVDDTALRLGMNTTSFGLSQPFWCPESPWLSCCELVVVVTQLWSVKLPWRAIATICTGEFPVLLTWTVTVVMLPDTESASRLAVTCPVAWLMS